MKPAEEKKASAIVKGAERVLIFTGAGISTPSGIPDFRGTGGIWKKREPVFYDDFISSEKKRREYWEYKLETFEDFRKARPNPAHMAIAGFERTGRLSAVVTQNIDSLHIKAGTSPEKIIELHGSNCAAACLNCGNEILMEEALEYFRTEKKPPKCGCGGILKPTVVMFGESLDSEKLKRAFREAAEADLVISAGSTLTVEPAASIPLAAVENGAKYLIVNIGPTAHDTMANLKIEADASEILPEILF